VARLIDLSIAANVHNGHTMNVQIMTFFSNDGTRDSAYTGNLEPTRQPAHAVALTVFALTSALPHVAKRSLSPAQ
jgi:hypothetical protein